MICLNPRNIKGKESGKEAEHLCPLHIDADPRSLCTSAFWVSKGVSPHQNNFIKREGELQECSPVAGNPRGLPGQGGRIRRVGVGPCLYRLSKEDQAPVWGLSCSDVLQGQTRTSSAGVRVCGGNSSSLPGHPPSLCCRSVTLSAQPARACVQALDSSGIFILFQLFSPQRCRLIVKSHLPRLWKSPGAGRASRLHPPGVGLLTPAPVAPPASLTPI